MEMPDVGHRLLRHALDLALLLARAVGLDREDAVHQVLFRVLGRRRSGSPLAHAGLAAVRLERLHKGQEPLRVVDLELEVRHGALAHGPLELGRVHVGVRVLELELYHLLGDHAPRRLELPPLAVLELHEARHEGAAGEAVGLAPGRPAGT